MADIIQEIILDGHKHTFYYMNLFIFYEFIPYIKTGVQIQLCWFEEHCITWLLYWLIQTLPCITLLFYWVIQTITM